LERERVLPKQRFPFADLHARDARKFSERDNMRHLVCKHFEKSAKGKRSNVWLLSSPDGSKRVLTCDDCLNAKHATATETTQVFFDALVTEMQLMQKPQKVN